jgi:hypothetical protein
MPLVDRAHRPDVESALAHGVDDLVHEHQVPRRWSRTASGSGIPRRKGKGHRRPMRCLKSLQRTQHEDCATRSGPRSPSSSRSFC